MISVNEEPRRRDHPSSARIVIQAALVAAVLGLSGAARSQDQNEAITKDAIFARKTLMDSLSDAMDRIETMVSSGNKVDLAAGNSDADTISVMLMAFPHLFPPASNQWKPNADLDPATDTFASPDVWTNYPDFYRRAAAAAKTAYQAHRADNETEFKTLIVELRAGCNSCHGLYLKAQ